jgi:hypothetical protein
MLSRSHVNHDIEDEMSLQKTSLCASATVRYGLFMPTKAVAVFVRVSLITFQKYLGVGMPRVVPWLMLKNISV